MAVGKAVKMQRYWRLLRNEGCFVNLLRSEAYDVYPGFYSFPLVQGASLVFMGVGYADSAALQRGLRGA